MPHAPIARFVSRSSAWLLTIALFCFPSAIRAQEKENEPAEIPDPFSRISKPGPFTANLGTAAKIDVPADYRFIPKEQMNTFADLTGNLRNNVRVGVLYRPASDWFIIFSFNDDGYVKDDEKDKLDADELFKALNDNQTEANKQLKQQKKGQLFLVRWEKPPFFDANTKNLTWALRTREERGAEGINYQSRILGRGGVMAATLVCSPEELTETVPTYDKLLTGFAYVDGQKYSDWRSGDKVAAYGLGGLVLGGAGVWAAKSGWLAKLLKPLLVGIAAVGAAIWGFFKKLFGRGGSSAAASSGSGPANPFE